MALPLKWNITRKLSKDLRNENSNFIPFLLFKNTNKIQVTFFNAQNKRNKYFSPWEIRVYLHNI